MQHTLCPCESCGRHLRANADECPFCAAPRVPTEVPPPAPSALRLSRAAMIALGASLAVGTAAAGCSGAAAYGVPPGPYDAQVEDMPDAGVTDAGAPSDGPPADDGGPAVRYGAPPPPVWC